MDKEDFYAQYDELAIKVLEDPRPNIGINIPQSNIELADEVCDLWEVDSFDIFEDIDAAEIYTSEDQNQILGAAYIYLLRLLVFSTAQRHSIGSNPFNVRAVADSEQWYVRLTERWKSLRAGTPTQHLWLH